MPSGPGGGYHRAFARAARPCLPAIGKTLLAVDQYPRLDLRHVVTVLRRRAWLIAGATIGVTVLVFALSSSRPDRFETFADVATVNPDYAALGSDQAGSSSANRDAINRRLATEAYYVEAPAVEGLVRAELGEDFDQITSLEVAPIQDTQILRITVASYSPEIAKAGADAYAESYVTQRRETLQRANRRLIENLDSQIETNAERLKEVGEQLAAASDPIEAQPLAIEQATLNATRNEYLSEKFRLTAEAESRGDSVSLARSAEMPTAPFAPTPFVDALVAGIVVLILVIGIAFLLDQLDNRIKTAEDVGRVTGGLPVIGTIPLNNQRSWTPRRFQKAERELVSSSSIAAEAYRVLATSLRFSSLGKEKRTILVTSTFGGEGKTTVTANLAAMLAESGLRVVIVSADLRRPQLGNLLGIEDTGEGLTSAMLGDSDLSTCFVPVALPSGKNVYVLPSGPLPHEPAVLLGSDAFGEMLEEIKEAGADFILIDCAPVIPVSDPLAASRHVDGVLLLALAERTKQASFRTAVERLRKVDASVIGVVLNGVRAKSSPYGYQYYGDEPYGPSEPPSAPKAAKGKVQVPSDAPNEDPVHSASDSFTR